MASLSLRTLRRGGASTSRALAPRSHPAQSRAFSSGILSTVQSGLMVPINTLSELILSSPLSYGATIVALTLGVRTAISLPAALWTRARIRRFRETVVPLIKAENERLAFEVYKECRRKGVGPEEYKKELKKRVADAQLALHKTHKTHPTLTMAAPFLINIPVLIMTSLAIRNAIDAPDSALVGQSLLWISDITEPDPQGLIGLLAGCLAFSSSELFSRNRRKVEEETKVEAAPTVPVEAVEALEPPPAPPAPPVFPTAAAPKVAPKLSPHLRRFSTSTVNGAVAPPRRNPRATPAGKAKAAAKVVGAVGPDGKRRIPMSQMLEDVDQTPGGAKAAKQGATAFQVVMEYGVKFWSVGLIGMSLFQPAALVAYWSCSITYTLVQNLIFARIDDKRDRELRAKRLAAAAAAPGPGAV